MRPWSRYIRASVLAYARVFVYLCGTPENFADESEKEGTREKDRERERTWEQGERERKKERKRPSPVKGKDKDGGKSQWPAKVCCPFVTRERVGTYT